jgi:hypothetical protein
VATILTFSMPGEARRVEPRSGTGAEVIVFPRTDIRTLRRWSEAAPGAPTVGEHPAALPGDGPA